MGLKRDYDVYLKTLPYCVGRDGHETGEFSVTIVAYKWREVKLVESFSGKNFYE
jgi:hypothetical protein